MSRSRDDPLPDDFLRRLLEGLDPHGAPPPPSLKGRVLQRIAEAEGGAGITTSRAAEGPWRAIAPGLAIKVLNDDGRTRSWLARLEAGARLPAHAHEGEEETLLVEGSCELGGNLMRPGDYQIARAGSLHGEVSTATGCLLFIRTQTRAAER